MKLNRKVFNSSLVSDGLPNWLFYFIPMVILCGWVIIVGPPYVFGYYIIHYLYTYKHGFIPRGLIGEIISWFTDSVSDELIASLAHIFSFVLAVSAALCIGKALSRTKNNRQSFAIVFFVVAAMCVMPGSFRQYFQIMTQDKLLWALTLFAVLLCGNRYTIWLVPICCIIATLINPVYLFCGMILIAIVLLQEFKYGGYSIKNGMICAVSYVSMLAIGIIGPLSEKATGFQTPQELLDFFFSRYAGELSEETRHLFLTEWLFDYFEPIDKILKLSYEIYFLEWGNVRECLIGFIFRALPLWLFLMAFWIKVIQNESNRFQKFIFFLCAISPVVVIPPTIISWEFTKYFDNNLIVQLCLIVYYIVHNHPAVLKVISDTVSAMKSNPVSSAVAMTYLAILLV